jgi:hypothetical protein
MEPLEENRWMPLTRDARTLPSRARKYAPQDAPLAAGRRLTAAEIPDDAQSVREKIKFPARK